MKKSSISGNDIHATKTVYCGIRFDSRQEAFHYSQLVLLAKAGEIKNLVTQPRFILQDGFNSNFQKNKIRPIFYVADFQYEDKDGIIHVEDVKGDGIITQVARLKIKMFLRLYPQFKFDIVSYKASRRHGISTFQRVDTSIRF